MREVKRNVVSPRTQRKEIGDQGNARAQSPSPKPAWSREDKSTPGDVQVI